MWMGRLGAGTLLLLAALMCGATAALGAPTIGQWQVCDRPPWDGGAKCQPTLVQAIDPQGRALWLKADVRIDDRVAEPAGVFISAYAASSAFWDGRPIGSNGLPSASAERERPGRRDAAFPIPDASPGRHSLALLLSSHHGAIRLQSPVTRIAIAPYERASSTVIRAYLPALICGGALMILVLMVAFAASGRREKGNPCLTAAAILAMGQCAAEVSRAFLDLPYPGHLLRIVLVLALATGFAFMLVAYLCRRFEMKGAWRVAIVQAVLAAAIIGAVPHFDQRTSLILSASFAIGLLVSGYAAAQALPGSRLLAVGLAIGLGLSLVAPYAFLDRDFYLWTGGFFLLIFAERLRARPAAGPAMAADLSPCPAAIPLGSAATRCFVLPSDIVRIAAADDYAEVFLADRRSILHPEPLRTLLGQLPAGFVRVHRSHAVNLAHLRAFRKGRSSTILLADGSTAPVSRRSVASLLATLEAGTVQAAMS